MKQEKNNKQEMPPQPGKRKEPPRSNTYVIIWIVIFAVLAGLLFFKDHKDSSNRELHQSAFEKLLLSDKLASAKLTAEGDGIFLIEGELKVNGNQVQPETYTTRVLMNDQLSTKIANGCDMEIKTDNSGFWNFLLASLLPVILIIAVIYFISMRQMRMNGRGAMDFGKSKARMIPPNELNVHFDDVAGAEEAKEEIEEIVEYLRDPLRFQLVGGKIPKGCLLVGDPGTGKTLMAKAVACEAGVPFFSISGSDFVEMFVGVGASRVRDMFEQARKNVPCLIFIDEIDAVGRSRFSGWGGGHDEREQTLNAMLVEMDGLESSNGVIVLAATNRPDVLDPALLRPGRFDRQVVMDLPDIRGRRQILDVHVKKIKTAENIDLDVIARTTPGFSGAELANLCNEAALLAARRGHEEVSQSDLEEARDKVSYGTERRSRKISDRERRVTAYHEAGHTLVALHNEFCVPVHKVTIIPRGQAALGATFMMPKEDTYLRTRKELLADMAMSIGGRVAEELIFQDISTGASADIQHMTAVARRMVCMFGMSEKLGNVKLGDFTNHPHLRIDGPPPEGISNETEREIDLEVRTLINNATNEARAILSEHIDQLKTLAETLLEKETLSIAEINELLGLNREETASGTDVETATTDSAAQEDSGDAAETPTPYVIPDNNGTCGDV
ncbi:MAG: ATP-dependent zinc metalloprotease FtsH [Lentisphaeria bacterium]|nr:ATP-dependent zinc metalloprotease FtsH [Lentisphaeria bacterium]